MKSKDGLVLIITRTNEVTVPIVVQRLREIKQPFYRLNTDTLASEPSKLHFGLSENVLFGEILERLDDKIDLTNVKSIWIRRQSNVIADDITEPSEKQFVEDEFSASMWSMQTCIDRSKTLLMNDPLFARDLLEHNKLYQLQTASAAGLAVPDTIISNDAEKLIRFAESKGGSIALKTVRSRVFPQDGGSSLGIYTQRITVGELRTNSDSIISAPIMAQEYIEKRLELRVTIVGNKIFTCAIDSQNSSRTMVDWRRYDFANVAHRPWQLPRNINSKLLDFMSRCHLTYGAIDMILSPDGRYVFLEVNPSGQYLWIERLTAMPISMAIAKTLARV